MPFSISYSYVDESKSSPASNIAVDLMKKMLPEYIVNCFLSVKMIAVNMIQITIVLNV